ncbi:MULTISPECIES: TIGR02452 family protein [Paenibacillus]|uniref:TIGR02452 family protein n=1 Tax=Paenibacillus TaxID=44249 RepID=UPI0022B912C2|nr:TIGR02452 family protein [Paenibacillus caseinilyticus]MCZ8523153.1 TIGR02452 family protein [Paenibacillus caseinilyticus]
MNRTTRAAVAAQTLERLEAGGYENARGQWVDLREAQEAAVRDSVLYRPGTDEELQERAAARLQERECSGFHTPARIELTPETTLAAAYRCCREDGEPAACLNFASAKNPGGGFLGGSQAQEESLARASGLYPCIVQMGEMYEYNRGRRTALYSDYMIYSPGVPVFRDDEDRLLPEWYLAAFITAPAVNAGVVREREPEAEAQIGPVMRSRIRRILYAALLHGHRTVVLGAYGCGVFRNRPDEVAVWFRQVLEEEAFADAFSRIVFAVYDRSAGQATWKAFEREFGGMVSPLD